MRIYAVLTDLPSDIRQEEDAETLIERASSLVTSIIRNARFDVDSEGMPTGEALEAAREAVVRQVSTWLSTGVNPVKGFSGKSQVAVSKGSNGSTVTYAVDVAKEAWLNDLADGRTLTPDALAALEEAGLTTPAIVSVAPYRRMYSPVGVTS